MRVVFFGTGAFGLPTLEAIHRRPGTELCGLITGPDKPQGRGRKPAPTPIAEWAVEKNCTPLLKPEKLKDSSFADELRGLNADVFVVVAYRILPESVFTIAPIAFNLHASLLPAYRGAAPVQRAIMAGETRTGVTTFVLQKTVDTGNILIQHAVDIGTEENSGDLAKRLAGIGAGVVTETLAMIDSGNLQPLPQDEASISGAPKITPRDRIISFDDPAPDVINRVRGLAPAPGAIARFRGKLVKLLALRAAGPSRQGTAPSAGGQVVTADPSQRLTIAVGDRTVEVVTLQPEGKRAQSGAEFVRGYRVQPGDRFESA